MLNDFKYLCKFFTKLKELANQKSVKSFIPQNFLGKLCEVKWNELALTPRDHGARPNGRGLP